MVWRPRLTAPLVCVGLLLLGAAVYFPLPGLSEVGPAGPVDIYTKRVWGVQDGLPQNRVQALAQTPEGYLWIGTSGGLARFDGVRFVVFNRGNTPAFQDDSILSLLSVTDGSLWVGTEGGGLLHYRQGTFKRFGSEEGLSNTFVRALEQDGNGTLWVGTDRGLFFLRGDRLERVDDRAGVPVLSVVDMHKAPDGSVWVAAIGGLYLAKDRAISPWSPPRAFPQGPIQRITFDATGALYLATPTGIYRVADSTLQPVADSAGLNYLELRTDSQGNLWAGTLARGLLRFSPSGVLRLQAPELLPVNTVHAVLQDREGNIWVGTQDGLVRLSPRIVRVFGTDQGLEDDNVVTVYEDRDGAVWIATISGTLYRFSRGSLKLVHLPIGEFRARTVFRDRDGALWVGSFNLGALCVLPNGRRLVFNTANGLRNNSIRQIYQDRRGRIWLATGSGLTCWDGHELRTFYVPEGLSYGSVRVLAEDASGDLIVGTDGGLNRLRDDRFVSDPVFQKVGRERIHALLPESDGTLWVGTRGGGLLCIRQGRFSRITHQHGLLSDHIFHLLSDGRGRMWISTPVGLCSVARGDLLAVAEGRKGSLYAVPYGVAEGLLSAQMNGGYQPAGCLRANGELWFPSVKGIVRIDPARAPQVLPSPVFIESVDVDDRPHPVGGSLRVPPNHSRLAIHYTSCSLLAPERISFQFKLEGFDSDWVTVGTRRTAYYTNLPPGAYRFRVAKFDAGAPDNPSEASIELVIEPHFYQTRWFYVLFASLIGLLVLAGFRLFAHQTRQRYQAMLEERARLAREMHDTVIQGCVAVSTLLEAASSLPSGTDGEPKQSLLNRARLQARITLDEARQAIWDLRHSAQPEGLIDALRDFAQRLETEHSIRVEISAENGLPRLDGPVRRNLLLVAREAMRNAALHASPSRITVRLSASSSSFHLEVGDDGRGFDTSVLDSMTEEHYGIAGMRERMKLLQGMLVIVSRPGEGTVVRATVPLDVAIGRTRRHS